MSYDLIALPLFVFTAAAWSAALCMAIDFLWLRRKHDGPRERAHKARSILLLLVWPIGLVVLFVGSLVILIREAFFNHD